jgi:hypothetical protein
LVLASWVLARGHVHASPWTVTGEAGAEVDTNVERVETGPGLDTAPVTSPVMRLGVRADKKDELFGGGYALHLSDLTRIAGVRSRIARSRRGLRSPRSMRSHSTTTTARARSATSARIS